ncbi:leucine-rich repeat-containing protein 42 [Hyperolius riggenbachi]|uniref:leucine-rich repeat-containing protein 42 n=1 Tax=Hyperolius riggenbachi TaxID=752182 RepID=UPI0035A3288C
MFQSTQLQRNGESGPVYVREDGRLFLVGSQPTQKTSRPARLFCKGFSVELCLKQEDACSPKEKPFIFTYTSEGSLRYSAKSLFTLALDLIADNIQHVDSLLGFPEQIAERLFAAAESRQQFSKPQSGLVALQKFTEAYGALMLSSLCLRGKYLLVSEKLEQIKSFRDLCSLDLSHCQLGDGHELLQHLTSDSLNSLRSLYLKNNCLSDAGIRTMTAPVRVMCRGLGNLRLLDLSGNPGMTEEGVKFLFVFKGLQYLDISDSGILSCLAVCQKLEAAMGLYRAQKTLSQFDHVDCRTQGWTEQLWSQWDESVTTAAKPKDRLKPRTAAQHFYGKEKINAAEAKVGTTVSSPAAEHRLLQFYRRGEDRGTALSPHSGHSSVKRSHDSSPQDVTPPVAPAKRRCPALTADDWELLNSY